MDKMKKMLEMVSMAKVSNKDLYVSITFNFYDVGGAGFSVSVIKFLRENPSNHVSKIFSSYKIEEISLIDFKAGLDDAINTVRLEAKNVK